MPSFYKFTKHGGIAPFGELRWPPPKRTAPGDWVEAGGAHLCRVGVHAATVSQLPKWLSDELWRFEFEGPVTTSDSKVSGIKGRLVTRVDGWNGILIERLMAVCEERAATTAAANPDIADLDAALAALRGHRSKTEHATVAYVAAVMRGAAAVGGFYVDTSDFDSAVAEERAWQAAWLAAELSLS